MSQSKRPAPKSGVPPRGGKGKGRSTVPPRGGAKGRSAGRPSASRPSEARAQSPSASGEARQAGWERRKAQRRQRNLYLSLAVAVVVIVAAIIIVKSFVGNGPAHSTNLAAGVQSEVAAVPVKEMVDAAEVTPIGTSSANEVVAPSAIKGPASLGGAHPQILYIGAEYCPYCAAERWALVMALSKFGSFTGLQQTTSSSTDVHPNTPTFSFVTAKYASAYLNFTAEETEDRLGKPLEKLTAQQTQLLDTYDKAPYVSSSTDGSIPFVLFGSQFVLSGAQYDASTISGQSMTDAATLLTASQTPSANASGAAATSQAAKAAAGHLLGTICAITGGKPASVCSQVPASLTPTGSSSGGQSSNGG